MKISVSNIAWGNENYEKFYSLLQHENCNGIELAPSKVWKNIEEVKYEEILKLKKTISSFKLEIVGFHSLLFGMYSFKIFQDNESRIKTKNYLFKLIDLCSDLGGNQLIFGSPNNRRTKGLKKDQIKKISEAFFIEIAEYCKKKGTYFCIEPLGSNETDFITSIEEGGKFVKNLNQSHFKLQIDTKALFFTKENPKKIISKYKNLLQHVHVSDTDLKEPGQGNNDHTKISESLKNINYSKFLSIEMRRVVGDEENSIKRSIKFLKKHYLKSV